MFAVLSTIIKGVVFFFSRLAVHLVYNASYVALFDMDLEQLLMNDQITASCQTTNTVKPRD